MRQVQFTPDDGFQVVEAPAQPLAAGEVRLKVWACGVCGSDRQVVQGESIPQGTTFPLVMGHEIAGGVVEAADDVTDWQVGDYVAVHPFIACGTCAPCQNEQPNLCIRQTCIGYQWPGGFASEVVVPAKQLIDIPDDVDSNEAALLVDAFATPYHAMRLAKVGRGQTVLVIGTGGLGAAATLLCRALKVTRIGCVSRRADAADALLQYGAQTTFSMADDARSVARGIRRWSGAAGIDVVVDTVATSQTLAFALDVVRPGGNVAVVGMSDEDVTFPIAKTVRRGIQVITSYGSTMQDVEEVLELTVRDELNPRLLVGEVLPLEQIETAFSSARAFGRTVLVP